MSMTDGFYENDKLMCCIHILAKITRTRCDQENVKVQVTTPFEMEHSYSRDWRPLDASQASSTRTLMVHRPPQCPSCHIHSHDEGIDLEEPYNPPIPSYNEENAKIAMQECETVAKSVKNINAEDIDWEERINKFGWSIQQIKLFTKVARLLDLDRLARLTNAEKQHEPVHRRVVIDKSVERLRQAMASVSWEARLTQWIHGLLLDYLSPSYLAAYLDILQTLKAKVPTLVDKMVFGRPGTVNQDVLSPVLKKPWEPVVAHKNRKLPGQPFIVVVPSGPNLTTPSTRIQKWYSLFATMSSVVPVQMPVGGSMLQKQVVQTITEQMVSITRGKIQEIRNEAPNRPIILVGFNAGASLAIQIGLVENVSCVVCIGFAYNTVNGVRGAPDDHIMDITSPILFVIGQNSARSSQEEIEFLREKMIAQTSLVVVGSADDCLRVCKSKRKIEGVTQSMVDNMVMDEIAEFATSCLLNPPKPKQTIKDPNGQKLGLLHSPSNRKRKVSQSSDSDNVKVKAPRGPKPKNKTATKLKNAPSLVQPTTEVLNMAIQSILPDSADHHMVEVKKDPPKILTSYQISSENQSKMEIRHSSSSQVVSGIASSPLVLPMIKRESQSNNQNIKIVPGNQFIQLKNSGPSQKIYTLKTSPKQIVTVPKSQAIVSTTGNKIFNLKTRAPQLTTTTTSFSPTKFTIMRGNNTNTVPSTFSNNKPPTPDLTSTNIFDIPIVFADNDGNIQESPPKLKDLKRDEKQSVASDNLLVNRMISVNRPNKVVVINKNAMKQCPPNMINSKNIPALKYTKVLLSNATAKKDNPTPTSVSKNLSHLLTQNSSGSTSGTQPKFQPIIINVDSDKTTAKNMVRVSETHIKPTVTLAPTSQQNTILIKTNALSQMPRLKPTILNRNLTVRKIISIMPQQQKQTDAPNNQ